MKLKSKIAFKLIKEYLGFFINCVIMLVIAYFFDKFFAMLLFIIFVGTIKSCFKIEFHADSLFDNEPIKALNYCKFISILVEIIYLIVSSKLELTIYGNIFVLFAFALVNSILEVSLETIVISTSKSRREKILKIVANDEKEIENLCDKYCLNNYSEVIYLYLNNTIEETSEILNIPVRTINNKINKFIRTIYR